MWCVVDCERTFQFHSLINQNFSGSTIVMKEEPIPVLKTLLWSKKESSSYTRTWYLNIDHRLIVFFSALK